MSQDPYYKVASVPSNSRLSSLRDVSQTGAQSQDLDHLSSSRTSLSSNPPPQLVQNSTLNQSTTSPSNHVQSFQYGRSQQFPSGSNLQLPPSNNRTVRHAHSRSLSSIYTPPGLSGSNLSLGLPLPISHNPYSVQLPPLYGQPQSQPLQSQPLWNPWNHGRRSSSTMGGPLGLSPIVVSTSTPPPLRQKQSITDFSQRGLSRFELTPDSLPTRESFDRRNSMGSAPLQSPFTPEITGSSKRRRLSSFSETYTGPDSEEQSPVSAIPNNSTAGPNFNRLPIGLMLNKQIDLDSTPEQNDYSVNRSPNSDLPLPSLYNQPAHRSNRTRRRSTIETVQEQDIEKYSPPTNSTSKRKPKRKVTDSLTTPRQLPSAKKIRTPPYQIFNRWTPEEDRQIIDYKENHDKTWKEISSLLTGRHTWQAVQMRYLRNLKGRNDPWHESQISKLYEVIEKDWNMRWKRISNELGPSFSPERVVQKVQELCKDTKRRINVTNASNSSTSATNASSANGNDDDERKEILRLYSRR